MQNQALYYFENMKNKNLADYILPVLKPASDVPENIVHVSIKGLDDIVAVLYAPTDKPSCHIALTSEMMQYLNFTLDDIHEYIQIHTSDALLKSMASMFGCPDDIDLPMYVLTNNAMNFGAGQLLLYKTQTLLREQFQGNPVYILPSSIHELILLPATDDIDADYLSGMVKEVNRTTVSEKDFLSNHVYLFDEQGFHTVA